MRTLGSDLSPELKQEAKRQYIHRFTGDHFPLWAKRPMSNGSPYPVQFTDDEEWLANTHFEITKQGKFSRKVWHCISNPTWPKNPELRRAA